MQRGCFDFPAAIGPQDHIFGEHADQRLHLSGLNRLDIAVEQLLVCFARGWEAWSMLLQMQLRPAKRAAAGGFTLPEHGSNLGKLVLEHFAQQEDRTLERLELLQQNQE